VIEVLLSRGESTDLIPLVILSLLLLSNLLNRLIPGIGLTVFDFLRLPKVLRVQSQLIPKTNSYFTLPHVLVFMFLVVSGSLFISVVIANFSSNSSLPSVYLFLSLLLTISVSLIIRHLLSILLAKIFTKTDLLHYYINQRIPIHFPIFGVLGIVILIYYTTIRHFYFLIICGGVLLLLWWFNETYILVKLTKEKQINNFQIIFYLCALRLLPWYWVYRFSIVPVLI